MDYLDYLLTLKVGLIVQQDLFSIIARFRTYPFAMTADLEKMYRCGYILHSSKDFMAS